MGGTGTDLPINLIGWALLGLSLTIGLWRLNYAKYIRINRPIIIIAFVFLLLFVPFLFGHANPQASTWYRFLALPPIYLFLLLSMQYRVTQRTQFTLVAILCVGICCQLAIALAQLSIMNRALAPFGHFQQVNLMGSYVMTGYACLFYLWASHLNNRRLFTLVVFTLVSFFIGLLAVKLQSRGTVIAGIAISFLAIAHFIHKRQFQPLLIIVGFCLGLGITFSLSQSSNELSKDQPKITETTVQHFQQDQEREILYPQVFKLITDNLVTGVGYGNFEAAYTDFSAHQAAEEQNPILIRHNMAHPHNELLFWFAEGGIIAGLAVILALLLLIYWLAKKDLQHKPLVWALFIPIGLHTLTEYPLQTSLPHLLILLILVRLFVLPYSVQRKPIPLSVRSLLRPVAIIMAPIGIAFGITGLHTTHLVLQYELSSRTSPAPYLRIINPFVHYDRYWSNIMAHKAMAAVENDDKQAIQEYIQWAEQTIQHHPRQVYFENMIRLKGYLGTLQKQDCDKYEFYFPEQRCVDLQNETPGTKTNIN